ncbi:hypothetical protein ACIQUB_29770 [Rhizobium sp. NPDC090275]|uniref:hypothetical protein n=1 Tax=Rhizobium sp. NPDC090275 TaxID=3364498 RepID=UPI00383B010E
MSIEDSSPNPRENEKNTSPGRPTKHFAAFAISAFVVLAVGAAGGATAMKLTRPNVEMAPLTPVVITSLKDSNAIVTIKGNVAEIYGNKFIMQDASGRALIETGPAGDDGKLVALDEPVTVQGRFDDGFLRASYIVHGDGKTDALRPPPGPRPHGGPLEEAMRHLKP